MRRADALPALQPAGPWQRWVLVMLVQALLALTLSAGVRAVVGPLHLHDDAAHAGHHHGPAGAVGRHWHHGDVSAAGTVNLEAASPAAEDLPGTAAASAAATLLAAFPGPPAVPRPERDAWPGSGAAPGWTDAIQAPPTPPPRG
jgi:hypothetical protein